MNEFLKYFSINRTQENKIYLEATKKRRYKSNLITSWMGQQKRDITKLKLNLTYLSTLFYYHRHKYLNSKKN